MQCPRCGQILSEGIPPACPRCGLPFAAPPVPTVDAGPSAAAPTGTPVDASQPLSQPVPPPAMYPPSDAATPHGMYAPPTLPPVYAPPYYAPPSGYGPYQPPVTPARGNRRLLLIFGVLAAVIVVGSLGALGLVLASNNGGGAGRVNTVAATPTPTLNEQQALKDPLTANTYGWPVNDHCFFQSDGYHIKGSYGCYAPVPAYLLDSSDTSVDVKLASASGNNSFGLSLRIQQSPGTQHTRFYAVELSSVGEWSFQRCDASCAFLVPYTSSGAIHSGVGASNTLRVIAQKTHFIVYINGSQVGQVDDGEFLDGQMGLSVSGTCEAVFTNMLISQIN